MLKLSPPDTYWKKEVTLFLNKRLALLIKMLYPFAIMVPAAATGIPTQYAAAVVGIVVVMAGTFGAGETLTADLNDGILARLALTPVSPHRLVFEILIVNAVLDFIQLLPAVIVVLVIMGSPLSWGAVAVFAIFFALLTANAIGVLIANFTSSPADVLLYATIVLFPLIYLSGFFRSQQLTGILGFFRGFVPFSYMNDALKAAFGLTVHTSPLMVLACLPTICTVLAVVVTLMGPRLLTQRV